MRLHLVSLPHTQTTGRFLTCAYTQKVVKFGRMMHGRGHELILYSGDENEAPCDEHVPLFTEAERQADWGDGFDTVTSPLRWDSGEPYWRRMNERATGELEQRLLPGDLLLLIGGWAQQPIAAQIQLVQRRQALAVEWGVGYEGVFCDFCAFESYAWMHHVYGRQQWATGRFYDAVIPNYFDPSDFRLAPKGDYLLFLGRLVERKGWHVAVEIARRVGMPLVLAGPGDGSQVVGAEHVGEVGRERRAELLAGARALLAPTLYLEPFGGAAVEAMLSGTPAVTTDFGAFTETVTREVGRRFRTLAQGTRAVEETLDLDPAAIRQAAIARYSLEAVRPRYDAWLDQLAGLWGEGWTA